MSRIQRALLAASLSAISLNTLTVPVTTFADSATAAPTDYVVKPGDSLAGIAKKVGVTLPDLLSVNNLTVKSVILAGQKLTVPKPPAPAAPPAAPAAAPIVYTVKAGDFLAGVAAQYKVTLPALLAANHITVKSVIMPGDTLTLPANAVAPQAAAPPAPAAAPPPAALTYVVKAGDFLGGIASKYKVKLDDLLAANKLKATSLILPGVTLALPASAVAPPAIPAPTESIPGPAGAVVAYAYAQLGKPYRFFTEGPNTFDCSGLVMAAYAQIGMTLVHQSAAQAGYGTPVDFSSQPLKPGDLIFMSKHPGQISHVGIAVDAGHWIQATSPGDVVRLGPIPANGVITAVRRLIP